jgi:hypothetical protein
MITDVKRRAVSPFVSTRSFGVWWLAAVAVLPACGGGTTEPAGGRLSPVVRVTASDTVIRTTLGETPSVTLRAETADGTIVTNATFRVQSGGTAVTADAPSGATATLRAVAIGEATLIVSAFGSASQASDTLLVIVRPPAGAVLRIAGSTAVDVDSSETRPVTITAVSSSGAALPVAQDAVGFAFADTSLATLQMTGRSGAAILRGRATGSRSLTVRLGGDSIGRLALSVAPSWPWLSVAHWYVAGANNSFTRTFLGIGARDSLLYSGPANGSAAPTRVPGLPKLRSVASSSQTACALDLGWQAWCAGTNIAGNVGRVAAALGINEPWGPVDGPERFIVITPGGASVFAMTADGRVFGWGFTPLGLRGVSLANGCGPSRLGYCAPVPFEAGRRFDRLTGGYGTCARETATNLWFCGGQMLSMTPALTYTLASMDSILRVDLGRFGVGTSVAAGQAGWTATAADGRALTWAALNYNQTSGLPATRDTIVIRAEMRWAQAPLLGVGVRADGIPLGFIAGQQLVGVPVVLANRPVEPAPNTSLHADACFRYVGSHDAACSDSDPQRAQTGWFAIPRPARP